METYIALNIFVVAFTCLALLACKCLRLNKLSIVTLAILLVLTAIFDSLIIGLNIVAYDESKLLGISIGKAPIEDFFYVLLAVILLPNLWNSLKKGKHAKD